MSRPLYLCLDQGGHSSRALVFDRHGRVHARGRVAVEARCPRPGRVEYDAGALLASVHGALDTALRELGPQAGDLAGAGLATQRSSIACWDRHSGVPLAPVLGWQDRRAAPWIETLRGREAEIRDRTGLVLSPYYGAAKLRWCLEHLPEVRRAAGAGRLAAGPLASYLVHRLVADHPLRADPGNAARTLLWNLATRDWDETLLACFGIPREVLPDCIPSRCHLGALAAGGTDLELLMGDQPAALFAAGRPDPETAYVNLGTGAFVQRVLHRLPPDGHGLLRGLAYTDDEESVYVLEGTVNGAASALDWAARRLGLDARVLPPRLERALGGGVTPVLFLNAISGLGSPYWRADLDSRFAGEGDEGARLAAVAESIVFLIMVNLETMAEILGPARRLRVTGGLAASDGLCRRLADLTGRPLWRPAETEATARGLAWLLAGKPRDWPAAGPAKRFDPQPAPGLAGRYRRWQDLMAEALAA